MFGSLANRMPSIRIDGPSIFIRPPQRRDEDQWVEIRRQSRGFLVPWEPAWPADAATPAAFRRRYRRFGEEWQAKSGYAFFIFEQESGHLAGGITLSNVRRGVSQSGSIGYWMGECYAGRGYMSEAVVLVLSFAFDTLGLNRVEAACLPHNSASRHLLVKLGFREEGLARRYLCIDGRWQDHVTHAILRGDPRPDLEAMDTVSRG
ncbi:MAG: GNAT family N-acetyltransferase [Alphaproteobacteria bacterium]|nr:GNAT family N-acetyltransferase [Alphaproteobacteria bacterium]